jgi:small subunit ribosomal protein S6
MRTYELILVFDPSLEVEQVENDLRKLNDMIGNGGLVRRWERWGKRRLAYEIKGRQYGYYVVTAFDAEAKPVAEIERSVRLNVAIIRHLVTLVDPKRVPEVDAESVRTLGAAPEVPPAVPPVEAVAEAAVAAPVVPEDDSSAPAAGEAEPLA